MDKKMLFLSDEKTGKVQRKDTESEGEWDGERERINEVSCAKLMSCLKQPRAI